MHNPSFLFLASRQKIPRFLKILWRRKNWDLLLLEANPLSDQETFPFHSFSNFHPLRKKMAQESWNKEINETEYQMCDSPILCTNNCGFFGSAMTSNLCSKCYRDLMMNQQAMAAAKLTVASSSSAIAEPVSEDSKELNPEITLTPGNKQPEEATEMRRPNRCLLCRKRVGLTGFSCRCGDVFCSNHRYPETHECSFDFKSAGEEAIAKANPVVKAEKIEKI